MDNIDDKTLVLLMSKVTNFDRDKTLKLSKKLSIEYEKAERIVGVLQNVILTGHLNDVDSIDVRWRSYEHKNRFASPMSI